MHASEEVLLAGLSMVDDVEDWPACLVDSDMIFCCGGMALDARRRRTAVLLSPGVVWVRN